MQRTITVNGRMLANRQGSRPAIASIPSGELASQIQSARRNDNKDVIFSLGQDVFIASDPMLEVTGIRPGQNTGSDGDVAGEVLFVDDEPVDLDPDKAASAIQKALASHNPEDFEAALLEALDHAETHIPFSGSVDKVWMVASLRLYPGGKRVFERATERYLNRFTGMGGLVDLGNQTVELAKRWPDFLPLARRAFEKAIALAGTDHSSRYELSRVASAARAAGMDDIAGSAQEAAQKNTAER